MRFYIQRLSSMTTALKSNNLVETNTSPKLTAVKPLFKYTVTYRDSSIDEFISDDWSAVLNYLLEDDEVRRLGEIDFISEMEGQWSEQQCIDWIVNYIREYASKAGYTIQEAK